MKNFIYKKVSTFEETLRLLSENREEAKVLAGGTNLLILMKQKFLNPRILIDVKEIPGAGDIHCDPKEGLTIGPLATIESIETSEVIQKGFRVISEAAGLLGSIQIRLRATLGGNLCHASPSADMAPCLIALGARVRIAGGQGERWIPLEDFFAGPGKTVLQANELLTSIRVPKVPPRTGCAYVKHSIRKAIEPGIVNVAVTLTLGESGENCAEIKIALGAVAPIPMRARKAEDRLRGRKLNEASLEEAASLASEEARPITDVHGSAEYRKAMVGAVTMQSIKQARLNVPRRIHP